MRATFLEIIKPPCNNASYPIFRRNYFCFDFNKSSHRISFNFATEKRGINVSGIYKLLYIDILHAVLERIAIVQGD